MDEDTRTAADLPYYWTPDRAPSWDTAGPEHRVAAFRLTDQDGRTVTNANTDGRVYVAAFFFTRCTGVCPSLRTGLARVQAAFRDDGGVLLLSHTVTPDLDSAAVLRAYARANGVVSGKWHLLTGPRDAIHALARRSYFADAAPPGADTTGADVLHTETFALVDGERRVRGLYDGTLGYDVDRLIADIRVLRRGDPDTSAAR